MPRLPCCAFPITASCFFGKYSRKALFFLFEGVFVVVVCVLALVEYLLVSLACSTCSVPSWVRDSSSPAIGVLSTMSSLIESVGMGLGWLSNAMR